MEAPGYCEFTVFQHLEGPQICRYLSAHLHIKKRAQNLRIHSSKPADLLIFELSNHPFRMTSEVSGHTKGVVATVVSELTRPPLSYHQRGLWSYERGGRYCGPGAHWTTPFV